LFSPLDVLVVDDVATKSPRLRILILSRRSNHVRPSSSQSDASKIAAGDTSKKRTPRKKEKPRSTLSAVSGVTKFSF
jgi:hypothetical protein